MKKEEYIIKNVSSNITYYRLKNKLTQMELAEKLNYSDKSISKWERAEGMPSVIVLNELADFFNITLNDLVNERKVKPTKKYKQKKPLLYSLIVWLITIIVFSILILLKVNYKAWHLFILASSFSGLIFFIFNLVWKKDYITYISFAVFIYMISLFTHLTFKVKPFTYYIVATSIFIFFSYLIYYLRRKD